MAQQVDVGHLVGPPADRAAQQPPPVIKDTAFWAHGVSAGLEFRY
jgi:hypothetical protein